MNIEKDFVWNETDGYAVLEKYVKKYKSARDLKPGEDPEPVQTKIEIPSEYHGLPVKVIFEAAFAMNEIIEEVIIPDSVEKIGCMAFNQCHALKKVKLSANLKRLGFFAFNDTPVSRKENYRDGMLILDGWLVSCSDEITELEIPADVKGIADQLFYFTSELKQIIIPETVRYIGMKAFFYGLELDRAVIPDTVEEADWQLFGSGVHIKKLVIPKRIYDEQKIMLRNGKNVSVNDPGIKSGKGIEVENTKIDEVEFI